MAKAAKAEKAKAPQKGKRVFKCAGCGKPFNSGRTLGAHYAESDACRAARPVRSKPKRKAKAKKVTVKKAKVKKVKKVKAKKVKARKPKAKKAKAKKVTVKKAKAKRGRPAGKSAGVSEATAAIRAVIRRLKSGIQGKEATIKRLQADVKETNRKIKKLKAVL